MDVPAGTGLASRMIYISWHQFPRLIFKSLSSQHIKFLQYFMLCDTFTSFVYFSIFQAAQQAAKGKIMNMDKPLLILFCIADDRYFLGVYLSSAFYVSQGCNFHFCCLQKKKTRQDKTKIR